ncbi:MAG: CvpA family protein [Chloroflexi bacterium]|nr:CvpA family protein [Chloroflexota bacterium]
MDIQTFLRSFQAFDLLIVLGMMALFILGFIQGTIRRLLGIASILFSFLVAAQLREPFGDFLAENWTQFPDEYSRMLAMGSVFLAGTIGFTIALQVFYRVVPLFEKYPVVDEVLGGILGVIQGFVIIACVIMILDPFYRLPVGASPFNGEMAVLRTAYEAYDQSGTAILFRTNIIPGVIAVIGALIPEGVKAVFPSDS